LADRPPQPPSHLATGTLSDSVLTVEIEAVEARWRLFPLPSIL